MRKCNFYNAGLVSLLCACAPKTSVIYMYADMDNPNLRTYSVSDSDDKIKREILEAGEDAKLNWYSRHRLLLEVNRRGLVVKTNELEDRTEVTVFFPVLYGKRDLLEGYSAKGHFKLMMELCDYGKDGTLDGLSKPDRLRFKNIIKASERVLKNKHKP